MHRSCFAVAGVILSSGLLPAQDSFLVRDETPEQKIEIPLPLVDPRTYPPGALEPLSPEQKARRAFWNTFGPMPLANRLLMTGVGSARNSRYWEDYSFAERFGSHLGSLAVRNSIKLGADLALGTDPRYDICACSGFLARSKHALRRVVVAHKDSGGETVNGANLAGAFATPYVTHTWYPDRLDTTSRKLHSAALNLSLQGTTNLIREFWPDIAHTLHMPGTITRSFGPRR